MTNDNSDRGFRRGNSDHATTSLAFYAISDTLTVTEVPEPSSIALLGLGGLMIARRRRG